MPPIPSNCSPSPPRFTLTVAGAGGGGGGVGLQRAAPSQPSWVVAHVAVAPSQQPPPLLGLPQNAAFAQYLVWPAAARAARWGGGEGASNGAWWARKVNGL